MIDSIAEIEKIIEKEINIKSQEKIMDSDVVFLAAEKLLNEHIKECEINMWPNGKGFSIMLCGTEMKCDYEKQISAFCSHGFGIETLADVKKSLEVWLKDICIAIDNET